MTAEIIDLSVSKRRERRSVSRKKINGFRNHYFEKRLLKHNKTIIKNEQDSRHQDQEMPEIISPA